MIRTPFFYIAPLAAALAFGLSPASAVAQIDGPAVTLDDDAPLTTPTIDGGDDVAPPPAEDAEDAAPVMTDEQAAAAIANNPALKGLQAEEIQRLGKLINEAAQFIQGIRLQEGLANLFEAELLAPDLFQIHNLRGAAYTKMRDFEKARASFVRAIELAPNVFHAQFNLAEIEFVTQNYEKAEQEFQRLLEENPKMDAGTKNLLEYKILICSLKQDNLAGANKQLAKFSYLDDTPAYYVSNAAIEFSKSAKAKEANDSVAKLEADEAAQQWIQSARNIYTEQQMEVFLDALVEAKWIETL